MSVIGTVSSADGLAEEKIVKGRDYKARAEVSWVDWYVSRL